ncbi:AAA family ATPase [Bacteroides togonis]|uniref:AAA family ATPase n=1 Tax=Bacteroides togonis TaxID=1917883 RepID=UPI00094B73AA|nr:ATP-binding protein [Bacteroides togonis]
MTKINPFITSGYVSPTYFCDRVAETNVLLRYLTNNNHVALISPRRLGKTGLIAHSFHQNKIQQEYYTFLIDIYATKNLQELVFELGKSILNGLRPFGRKAWDAFLNSVSSLRSSISFDYTGNPSWNLEMGDIKAPVVTLDEVFQYIEHADKPCLIAIDEFQVIAKYPEKNVEALLRTQIQHCNNATFIFSGSQRHMMGEIFTSPSRPFYQSTAIMDLKPIQEEVYCEFAQHHFSNNGKHIETDAVHNVYQRFEGITWYIQFVLNSLYSLTQDRETCTIDKVEIAIDNILAQLSFTYSSLLFQLPAKQKEVLMAICKEGKAKEITSSRFLNTYKLTASSVQGAIKGLLDKDFVTYELGIYSVYDKFFEEWLRRQMK